MENMMFGDPQVLTSRVTPSELRAYRRYTNVPWYRSVTCIAVLCISGIVAVIAGFLALLPVLLGPYMHPSTRPLVIATPVVWIAAIAFGFPFWLRWQLRDTKLFRFAVLNGLYFEDRIKREIGIYHNRLRIGTGFPKHRINIGTTPHRALFTDTWKNALRRHLSNDALFGAIGIPQPAH